MKERELNMMLAGIATTEIQLPMEGGRLLISYLAGSYFISQAINDVSTVLIKSGECCWIPMAPAGVILPFLASFRLYLAL
jgi:hypothetical protein